MILWIESQSTAVIVLVVLGLFYALAAIVFVAAVIMSHLRIAPELNAITPVLLTPLSMIASLLIAFLAARVWANVDRANTFIGQEASAIRETMLLSDTLPNATRRAVHDGVRTYVQWVDTQDWPAMLANGGRLSSAPPGLFDAAASLLSFVPSNPGQTIAQQGAVAAIDRTMEARRNRILLSRSIISSIQWFVIFLLDALILLTMAMVHLNRRIPMACGLFLFSTAIAACAVLLMVNDRPLSMGGVSLSPAALHELSVD